MGGKGSEFAKRILPVVWALAVGFSLLGIPSTNSLATGSTLPPTPYPSFPGDCKDPASPYLHIEYSLEKGNHGVCGPVKIDPPKQVVDGEECPPKTRRQRIYQFEGSEAVCLTD